MARGGALSVDNTRPLSELPTGQSAIVQDLRGGYGFRSRLAVLGFTPGVEITMLQNLSHGPIIVNLRDTRIALGRGEAKRILVKLNRKGK